MQTRTENNDVDERPEVKSLFAKLRVALPELEKLLAQSCDHSGFEDPVYRFYHQSFKVYGLQKTTLAIVHAMQALAPDRTLNKRFMAIIEAGTGKTWQHEHNRRWDTETRPIVEAFFHARYFLEMAVRYGRELKDPPLMLPSGWAAFLYLYNLR